MALIDFPVRNIDCQHTSGDQNEYPLRLKKNPRHRSACTDYVKAAVAETVQPIPRISTDHRSQPLCILHIKMMKILKTGLELFALKVQVEQFSPYSSSNRKSKRGVKIIHKRLCDESSLKKSSLSKHFPSEKCTYPISTSDANRVWIVSEFHDFTKRTKSDLDSRSEAHAE